MYAHGRTYAHVHTHTLQSFGVHRSKQETKIVVSLCKNGTKQRVAMQTLKAPMTRIEYCSVDSDTTDMATGSRKKMKGRVTLVTIQLHLLHTQRIKPPFSIDITIFMAYSLLPDT